jgi:hypothetical protein
MSEDPLLKEQINKSHAPINLEHFIKVMENKPTVEEYQNLFASVIDQVCKELNQ